jgi:hypothetical protein
MSIVAVPPQKQFGPEDVQVDPYDFEALLPISLIRSHTKTDDIPSVTDELLVLYRGAALRAAEEYTGILFSSRETRVEDVRPPVGTDPMFHRSRTFKHTLAHATADGRIWYYGKKNQQPRLITVQPGTTELNLPRDYAAFGLGCCNPGGPQAFIRVMYVAGLECLNKFRYADVLKLGALKYIAHVAMNAGDNVIQHQVSGRSRGGGAALDTAANPALASGAIEIWRTMVRDAI